jgi:hypothetical protein
MYEFVAKGAIAAIMAVILCASLLSIRSSLIFDFASARKRLLTLSKELLGGFNLLLLFVLCCITECKTFYLHGLVPGVRKGFLDFLWMTLLFAAICVGVPVFALLVLKVGRLLRLDGLFVAEASLKVVPDELR